MPIPETRLATGGTARTTPEAFNEVEERRPITAAELGQTYEYTFQRNRDHLFITHNDPEGGPSAFVGQRFYRQDAELTPTDKAAILRDYNVDEREARLRAAVGPRHAPEFAFEESGENNWAYRHAPTGNVISLDSQSRFYDSDEGQHRRIARAEVLRDYQEPNAETLATLTPQHREQWTRLEKEIGFKGADNFNLYEQRGDINVYVTNGDDPKKVIALDSKGQFYEPYTNEHQIARPEALQTANVQQHFYTPAPPALREAVGNDRALDFSLYNTSGGIDSYDNERINKAIHIDSAGHFYNRDRQPVSRDEALSAVYSPGPERSGSITAPHVQQEQGSGQPTGSPHLPRSEGAGDQSKTPPPLNEQSISF